MTDLQRRRRRKDKENHKMRKRILVCAFAGGEFVIYLIHWMIKKQLEKGGHRFWLLHPLAQLRSSIPNNFCVGHRQLQEQCFIFSHRFRSNGHDDVEKRRISKDKWRLTLFLAKTSQRSFPTKTKR